MSRKQERTLAAGPMVLLMIVLNAIILEQGMVQSQEWYALLFVTIPLFIFSIINSKSKVPRRLGTGYGLRKPKRSFREYKREKQISEGDKSSRPPVASAALAEKKDMHM
jgi:hypothetical protein